MGVCVLGCVNGCEGVGQSPKGVADRPHVNGRPEAVGGVAVTDAVDADAGSACVM